MTTDKYKKLIEDIKNGKIDTESAYDQLKNLPFHDLGYAKVDHHRKFRQGTGEIIFCQGKSVKQIIGIINAMEADKNIIASRASLDVFKAIKKEFTNCRYYRDAKVVVVNPDKDLIKVGLIVVATGGTADIPIAEEAAVISELLGNKVKRIYDVGTAMTGTSTRPPITLGKAPSMPATAMMTFALSKISF